MTIDRERDGRARMRRAARVRSLRLPPVFLVILAAFSLFVLHGCGDREEPQGLTKQAVAIGDVPEDLRKAAQKAVPGVDLNEAWKNLDTTGTLHSYEIRGRNAADGKIREVRVSTDGKILETE
ncbi:MAG TPA: hypothetical protein VKA15_06570 [Isosphaeraceae bacterium]|nr:hypothetical protein [Isosphaeraceae bacterium]